MSQKSSFEHMTVWEPRRPWNTLPLLPPRVELETRAVLKRCITARAALAELKQAAELIPNKSVLINTLPLLEAQASSEIENIVTTTDRLFRFRELDEKADPATKEALRYGYALMHGYQALQTRPLNTATAELICSRIKGTDLQVRRLPGTALAHQRTGEIIYTPPEGETLLRDLLANWETFLHSAPDLDPLVCMAVSHYQFEAIHPFSDGNGRTGRVLNSLFLIQEGLLSLPILYLSRYITHHKADYYRLLLEVTREANWEGWLLYLLHGVEETANWTTRKIGAIRRLSSETAEYLRRQVPKAWNYELVNLIFERPYTRIGDVVAAGIGQRQAASRYLQQLVGAGVLEEKVFGKEKLFRHPKFLRLLTEEDNDLAPYPSPVPLA